MSTNSNTKPRITRQRARDILREYPDADLSGFDIEGDPDVDPLASEEADRTLGGIAERLTKRE